MSDAQDATQPDPTLGHNPLPAKRRRGRRRWWLRLGVLLGLAALTGLVYLTRPATLASIILPRVAQSIGGDVSASRISLSGINSIDVQDLRIRARGWNDISGELVYADRIRCHFSLLALLIGELKIGSVQADRVEFRLAEASDRPGEFSLFALTPTTKPASPSSSAQRPTEISIENLILENGVVTNDGYRKLGDLRFRATLTRSTSSATALNFSLFGRPNAEGRLAIANITGSFDGVTHAASVEVDDLVIDGRQLAIAPIAVRTWTSRLGLEGRVSKAKFSYGPNIAPSALIDLKGVAMNIPADALGGDALDNAWSGFAHGKTVDLQATPRMTLRSGTLVLEENEVRFEHVTGELGADASNTRVLPVPFEGEFRMTIPKALLPAFEWDHRDTWITAAAQIAPFSLSLAIRDFSSPEGKEGDPDTLQLPRAATKVLSDFNITSWTIDIDSHIDRGPPTAAGKPGPLQSTGTLVLDKGSGAFEEFPYQLEDVRAVIKFRDDNLVVESLTANGADGAKASITGRLDGLSTGAEIDLRITCADAPIDERLFSAFEPAPREALELLFDARSARSLNTAGLLPDANALIVQRQELSRLSDDEANRPTRERLQRSISAGPFQLGGRCGFEIRVYSEPGWGKPVVVTGDVRVHDAGLLFARFPYPLRLKEGAIRVLDEAIEIMGDGLKATTPAGGELLVTGSVQIPRMPKNGSKDGAADGAGSDRGLRPLIRISDKDDALNPALLAAIPHAGDEMPSGWPGADLAPAGQLLGALGLSGRIQLDGLVDSDESGKERFSFKIDFDHGTAAPDAAGRAELDAEGMPWPPEFQLEDCTATLLLTPERVVIEHCEGRNGTGSISAKGYSELEGPNRLIELELKALPIGRAFEGYLASDPAEAAARFARYAPSGAIDGTIRREVTETSALTSGSLTPQSIELNLDGTRMRAERIAGRLAVSASGVRADSLEFRLFEGDLTDGILRLSGPLSSSLSATPEATPTTAPTTTAAAAPAPLDATITAGRIESPLLRELLATRAKGVIDLIAARAAKGTYDAHYQGGENDHFEITPRTLGIGQADERVELAFDPKDSISGNSELVRFDVHGTLTGLHAGTLTTSGSFESGNDNRVNASMKIDARELTVALRKHLPPPMDLATETLACTTKGRFELDLPDIALRWPATGSAESPDIYQIRGAARLLDASLSAGPSVSALNGEVSLRLRYEPRAALPIDFTAQLTASSARVFDRPISATSLSIASGDGGKSLSVNGSGDVAFGRFDLVSSIDFDKDTYRARARVADADFEVLRLGTPLDDVSARSTSRLSAVVLVEGSTSGAADTRTGNGRVGIRNATLASLPLAMRVLQITQLMLPISSQISASDAIFNIKGNTAEITRCDLAAGTIQLTGSGTVDIPTFGIGLRVFPRGTIPIVSDVIGGVTNQFFAIDVSGTLSDPKASIAALPGITDIPAPPPAPIQPTTTPTESTATTSTTPSTPPSSDPQPPQH